MKFGVVVFPGSNCDHDAYHAVSKYLGQPVGFIWHKETDLSGFDAVIVPGGFSYGDYLRAGALARFSPVMRSIKEFAAKGKYVFGICNGFQILCEAGLLPGALMRNAGLHFVCKHVIRRSWNRVGAIKNDRFDLIRVERKLLFPGAFADSDRESAAVETSNTPFDDAAVFETNGIGKHQGRAKNNHHHSRQTSSKKLTDFHFNRLYSEQNGEKKIHFRTSIKMQSLQIPLQFFGLKP